ncbi:PilZ domain-containing protein [Maledivibacter halophilus]|uniref:PilZ domain-containing protein n=1 Tax=Maledivibacter halophilus TaxID=36842 RepID=A0A1T5M7M0_9FIRM|nr:PilZ domain-containing protein [Maledivibacter halophilus]SKC84145.1 PilZ domain-containing protein [Maledivibacter halophilus]
MENKRKSKRLPVNIKIKINSLYKSGDETLKDVDNEVTVINLSKTGIGFISETELPIGYFFNAKIIIDEEKMFYSVLRIVRNQKINEGYIIGCEFVGLANVLSNNIDEYEKEIIK